MMPKIIIMCGLSASGKSSVAQKLAEKYNATIVSSDSIRGEICDGGVSDQSKNEEVFKIFHNRIRECLKQNINVIADATNITIKSRRAILDKINGLDCEKICYIIPKRYEDCLIDNKDREYPVPDEVIRNQMYRFQIPFYEEGFDKIIIEKMPYVYEASMLDDMIGFNQKNPHHKYDLNVHCAQVEELFRKKYKDDDYVIASYLHDVGKLFTQTFDENGIAHYFGHDNVGSYKILTHFNYLTVNSMLKCCFLINYHMLPFTWKTEKTHNKWKKIFGEDKYNMLIFFNECDKVR